MANLELLASGPGTGKTSYCIDIFRKEIMKSKGGLQSRSFFVLPNREHAERIQNLILKKEIPGLFNAHILTLKDLTSMLLGSAAGRHPNDALRMSIMAEIFEDPSLEWHYFDAVKNSFGFRQLLIDRIKEMSAGLLTVDELEKRAQPLLKDAVFRSKFRDFTVVLKEYTARLESLSLREADADMQVLTGDKHKTRHVADVVIFDGFYHFTRAQQELIRFVSKSAKSVVVSLTLPKAAASRANLFHYPQHTCDFLKSIGFAEKKSVFRTNWRTSDASLRHLESHIFEETPPLFRGKDVAIEIFEAPNMRTEAEMIAREIKFLYRENKFHYSDICVIFRSVSGYESLIEEVFGDFGVPVAVHERKKLIEHGFASTFWRFLNLAREDWRREDVIAFLRSSFLEEVAHPAAVAALERYAFSHGLTHKKSQWLEAQTMASLPPEARQVLSLLLDWERSLITAGDAPSAVCFLKQWMRPFMLGFNDETNALVFAAIERLLESMEENILNTTSWNIAGFARRLQESLRTALFSVKAPTKNRVQVYDVVMALPKEYKAVFVAGLLEGVFPDTADQDPLFKDIERKILNTKNIVLEERAWRDSGERTFFYMACARAKEKLYFSYPTNGADDRPTLASFFIEEAKKCFGGNLPVRKKALDGFIVPSAEWECERDLFWGAARSRRDGLLPPDRSAQIREWHDRREKAQIRDPRVLSFFAAAKRTFSATRLELYATCAFKYFASRVLNLDPGGEGHEFRIMGNMLHESLEHFYKKLSLRERRDPAFWSDERAAKARLLEEFEKIWTEDSAFAGEPLYRRRLYRDQMRGILSRFVLKEKEMLARRALTPTYFELHFGDPKKSELKLGSLRIPDKDGDICIEGHIDRIDVDATGKKALIIDYKRSKRRTTIDEKLAKGTEFQLPVYILAVSRLMELEVLGAELRPLKEAQSEGLYREAARTMLGFGANKRVRTEGEWLSLLNQSEQRIRELVKDLSSGRIDVRPKTCDLCDFNPVCRFERADLAFIEYEKKHEPKTD